jgi:hypothetical protein
MIEHATSPRSMRRLATLTALPVSVGLIWLWSALVTPGFVDDFLVVWGVSSTVTTSVGALILWRRPGHRMGRLLIAVGVLFGATAALSAVTAIVDPTGSRFGRLTAIANVSRELLGTVSLLVGSIVVVVRFPSGRRTSRLGLVIEVLVASAVFEMALGRMVPAVDEWLGSVGILPGLVAYPLAVVDIVVRYRHAAAVERAQFRWLIAAATVPGALVVLMLMFGGRADWLWGVWIASTILPTLAVGVAVLRYRLYEIDRIISRTIAYGALSLVLFAIFFATNVLLQRTISPFVDGNDIATVASTLLVASLFQPVRRQAQRVMDRRFHRARYDAEQTLDAFAGRLRHGVDLPRLVGDLRRTAGEAVEPSASVVWLRESAR